MSNMQKQLAHIGKYVKYSGATWGNYIQSQIYATRPRAALFKTSLKITFSGALG